MSFICGPVTFNFAAASFAIQDWLDAESHNANVLRDRSLTSRQTSTLWRSALTDGGLEHMVVLAEFLSAELLGMKPFDLPSVPDSATSEVPVVPRGKTMRSAPWSNALFVLWQISFGQLQGLGDCRKLWFFLKQKKHNFASTQNLARYPGVFLRTQGTWTDVCHYIDLKDLFRGFVRMTKMSLLFLVWCWWLPSNLVFSWRTQHPIMRSRILLYSGVEIQECWAQEVSFHCLKLPRFFRIRW